jgi:integrase
VLDWAKVREYRTGENPARWKGHLDKLLPARAKIQRVAHHPALAYAKLPAFMAELRAMDGVKARALEFLVLTAARTGDIIGARWSEIDLQARQWIVPAGRMKAAREHRVPLSDRAHAILEAIPRDSDFLFPGERAGKAISARAMPGVLYALRGDGATVHGFRSSFRDWAGNETNFPRELAEQALAHVAGDATERAYRRSDALAKRRKLMDAWAAYCSRPPAAGENVVAIREAAK